MNAYPPSESLPQHDTAEAPRWDEWAELFAGGDITQAMAATGQGLHLLKARASVDEWRAVSSGPQARALRQIAHECPYSRRGFDKPRGYAGDAVLLDYIYGSAPVPEGTTERGRRMLAWMRRESTGFASVRWRRDYFASRLDALATTVHRPRVAVVAGGHFREGQRSLAVRSRAFDTIQLIDQDPVSLDVVEQEQAHDGVTPIEASVRDIITGRHTLDGMDFIYSAGLYDYLAGRFATRLTAQLFAALRPGGTLIVANFVRMMEDGWMEALMDWWLLYRTPEEVGQFSSEIPDEMVASQRVFMDPFANVAYLEIVKR